ncbi:NAD(P)H-quinone oxidoreductase subunit K [Tanacetum coccineum]
MASMNTRLNIKKLDENIVQKHGGSKQVGFKQLGPCVETGVHGVSNDETAVAQRRLKDKQPKENTNMDCLVKEQEKEYQTGWKIKTGNVYTTMYEEWGCQTFGYCMDTTAERVYISSRSLSSVIGFKKPIDMLEFFCWLDKAKGNVLGMEIVKDQSGNTLRVSLSRLDIASADVGLLDKFDRRLQTDVQVFVDFDYAIGRSITVMESRYNLRLVSCIATGALVKGGSRSEVPAQVDIAAYRCCFIEFASLIGSRFDFDRYGLVPRSSPRQADLILTAGTVTMKMAPSLVRLYEQMPEPKYVIAMGACTITGGMFSTDSYSTVRGVDKLIPVDVYLPGCPPKPEAIIDAITKLRKKISREIYPDRILSQRENRCFTTNHKFKVGHSIHTGNYDQGFLYQPPATSEIPPETFFKYKKRKKMQGNLSAWLVKHGLIHRSLGFDYQGIETLQIKPGDWHSIAVILYVYGYNYLRSQCAYDVAPGGLLASVYHLTRIEYGVDQPEEVCIKVFAPRRDPRIPSVFWVWKSVDFQERESYDMLGIYYDNHPRLKRILMPESWIGWPLRKDYVAPNFYEIQDAH